MVIDASAIVAILLGEPEADQFMNLIANDARRLVGAISALEAAIVMNTRKGPPGVLELDLLIQKVGMTVVSMSPEQVRLAREAYAKYGKGQHSAGLNLGDCCSYALARYTSEPLLFKGDDFRKTDIGIVGLQSP